VIDAIVDLLKHIARPSGVAFVVLLLIGGVALAFVRRTERAARWYFLGLLAFYWFGASPAVAERLVRWQGGGYRPIRTVAEARGARVVVVLGAGNYTVQAGSLWLNEVPILGALRILEGARLYALLDRPTIIVSGGVTGRAEGARSEGDAMRTAMMQLGVPSDHILVEAESQNTRDEAAAIARMLANRPRQPIVLVTSPTHMTRSVAVFRRAGLDIVPSAAPIKPDHVNERLRWLPNDRGLWLLDVAVYDLAATWYYRIRGWM
jgi:uncharacterized SAM-binding protein YcdF (DUF218 family)